MGHREKLIDGDEFDAFISWKKALKVFAKPGISAKTKNASIAVSVKTPSLRLGVG